MHAIRRFLFHRVKASHVPVTQQQKRNVSLETENIALVLKIMNINRYLLIL